MKGSRGLLLFLVFFVSLCSFAQERGSNPEESNVEKSGKLPAPAQEKKPDEEKPPVVTHHEIHAGGKLLKYTATTGLMPIRNADGEIEAHIFFVSYALDNPGARRPLTFSFNGGPGSSSVWLHMGAIGPKRVKMLPEGFMPAPPYQLVDNDFTWLDQTDLVFIDPVGTGYSRAAKKDLGKKFWSVKGDVESVGEFIRLYLTRFQRWGSPLFVVGESYGTTRAAGLSGYLIEHGIAFNGIILVSSVLNFETLEFTQGNDLPYILFLPSYTAAAWYHKKLSPELEQDLQKTLREVEQWTNTYAEALAKGDRLSAEERQAIANKLAQYTGLSPQYILNSDLRIEEGHFVQELLRDQRVVIGRLDSRFTGAALSGVAETQDFDPSMAAIRPPYTSMFNNYVRAELGYQSDAEYYILGGGFPYEQWQWGSAGEGFPNVSQSLREAFVKNPYMKLFVASGYFDLATPFFATQYTLEHLSLNSNLRKNISTGEYEAGHMMYIRDESLSKLKHDVSGFMANALK
jgi:carboxypeptidase C (cathepsin A)